MVGEREEGTDSWLDAIQSAEVAPKIRGPSDMELKIENTTPMSPSWLTRAAHVSLYAHYSYLQNFMIYKKDKLVA